MTLYTRTIPSAVLGEYLSDVQRFHDYFARSPFFEPQEPVKPTLAASLEHGLAGSLNEWFWPEEAIWRYWHWLLGRNREEQRRQRHAEREAQRTRRQQQERAEAAKVEAVKVEKPKPKRKPWQDARQINEGRIREAILKVVRRHGWTDVGERKLGELAGLKHRTARTVLDRMAEDGQIKLDRTKERGRRTGVYVIREHPCWSDTKHAQSLAQSKLSSQVRG